MILVNDDCIKAMEQLNAIGVKVDAVITDPPFLHIKGGMKSKTLNKGVRASDNKIVSEMSDFGKEKIYDFLDKVKQLQNKVNVFVFCSKLQIPYYLNWSLENKCQFDLLVWDKCFGGIISHKFFSTSYEYIIRLYEKGLQTIDNPEYYQKVQRFKRENNKLHPAQKPLELIKRLVELSTVQGEMILDPFMGSGTTGEACGDLKRDFIGIELEKNYFDIAQNRLLKFKPEIAEL